MTSTLVRSVVSPDVSELPIAAPAATGGPDTPGHDEKRRRYVNLIADLYNLPKSPLTALGQIADHRCADCWNRMGGSGGVITNRVNSATDTVSDEARSSIALHRECDITSSEHGQAATPANASGSEAFLYRMRRAEHPRQGPHKPSRDVLPWRPVTHVQVLGRHPVDVTVRHRDRDLLIRPTTPTMDERLEPQPPNAESGHEGRVRRCRAAEGGGLRRPGHGSPRQSVENPARDEPRRGSEGPPKSVRVKRAGSTGCRRSGESPILAEVCRRTIGIENFARDKCHVDVLLFRIASDHPATAVEGGPHYQPEA
jgi:hypothetical protein